ALPSGHAVGHHRTVMNAGRSKRVDVIVWSVGLVSIALSLAALALMATNQGTVLPEAIARRDLTTALDVAVNALVPVIGIVLATRAPGNPIGWLFLGAGLFLGLGSFAQEYAIRALLTDPGSLPVAYFFAWLSNWVGAVPTGVLPFLFLLFPDGKPVSAGWRWALWASGITLAVFTVSSMALGLQVWSQPFEREIFRVSGEGSAIAIVAFTGAVVLMLLWIFVGLASLVVRFRGSVGEERLQLKWFVTAAALVAVCFSASTIISDHWQWLSTLSLLFLYVSIAIAVLKYRLYDIDVVIGKTVVFTVLAGFITLVYVGIVVGVGTLVGSERSPWLSALAAAVVAVAFQPVREAARRLANRVVYGRRATPYEVLAGFVERAGETYSTDDVLPQLVRVLAEGIGATRARVWLATGSEFRASASWPADGAIATVPRPDAFDPSDAGFSGFPDGERAFPVVHAGELLGAISVQTPPNEPLGSDRERLVSDVAAQTGLVLRNVRLIEDLRESRRRIVTAQDERAKTLERNIHDGAQQQLVALAIKERLAGSLVDRDPAKAKQVIDDIQAETLDALENLRDLARGIYPPLLADKGLMAALEAQGRKAAVPVEIRADALGRYPQAVESAVYFSCLEAMQNVAKYANATRIVIELEAGEHSLQVSVIDDGVGFDTAAVPHGSGLQGMADRMDAINGSLEIRSAPGSGTVVTGTVPLIS
ncbi:MAG TPA: histidine kinase, partial [Actinomycetota bacterium]